MLTIAWYICPYKRKVSARPTRYCAMDDFTWQICYVDLGGWAETEILGNQAIVKVKAETTTLATLDTTFTRLPTKLLTDSLSDLTTAVKNQIKTQILAAGYTAQEIQTALGADIGLKTFADLLRFLATRRLTPRYDQPSDTIVCDGEVCSCKSPDLVDGAIQ